MVSVSKRGASHSFGKSQGHGAGYVAIRFEIGLAIRARAGEPKASLRKFADTAVIALFTWASVSSDSYLLSRVNQFILG